MAITRKESNQPPVPTVVPYSSERDELYYEALKVITSMGRASCSVLQFRLKIGFSRAEAIMDQFEADGLIEPRVGAKPPRVLAKAHQLLKELNSGDK